MPVHIKCRAEVDGVSIGSTSNTLLERRHPLTYWLEYVRTLGRPDSPVLVVQSQCDTPAQAVPVPPVDACLLESFGCLRVCNFSARTRRGAASLQEALADANTYLRDRDGISSIGRGRHLVWQQLETWRQADQQLPAPQRLHRTLSQADFARLCEQIGGVSSPEACGFCTTRAWCFTARISSTTAFFSINPGR
jgi:internalin A